MDDDTTPVDETTPWRKSSFSGANGGCVALRRSGGRIQVSDTKLGSDSPVLSYNRAEIEALLRGLRAGEFDDLLDGVI